MVLSPRQVKLKSLKVVFAASLLSKQLSGMRAKTAWLRDSEPSSLCSHAWHIILILSQAVFALMPDTLSWFWAKQSLLSCLTHYPDSEPSSLYSHAWHIILILSQAVFALMPDTLSWFLAKQSLLSCLTHYPDSEPSQDNVSGMRAKTARLRIRIMCQAWE
jgi:hypothetical protein